MIDNTRAYHLNILIVLMDNHRQVSFIGYLPFSKYVFIFATPQTTRRLRPMTKDKIFCTAATFFVFHVVFLINCDIDRIGHTHLRIVKIY